jgi:hypothetical protein
MQHDHLRGEGLSVGRLNLLLRDPSMTHSEGIVSNSLGPTNSSRKYATLPCRLIPAHTRDKGRVIPFYLWMLIQEFFDSISYLCVSCKRRREKNTMPMIPSIERLPYSSSCRVFPYSRTCACASQTSCHSLTCSTNDPLTS